MVLSEAARSGRPAISRAEISRRVGIPETNRGKQWITSWVLFWLEEQGKVRQHKPRQGWSLAR